jgi:hypothetical protein
MGQDIDNAKPGDIFVAADNGIYGVIVLAAKNKVDDVNLCAFTSKGPDMKGPFTNYFMDAWKLTYRYRVPDIKDWDWIPESVNEYAWEVKENS